MVHHGILNQSDGIATNDDGRFGRFGLNIVLTINRGVFVCHRCKVVRRDRIDELPRIGMISTIGISVIVGHCTMAIGIHDNHRIAGIRYRENLSMASVLQRVRFGYNSLSNTSDFCCAIGGNRQRRQLDNVGE